MQVKLKISFLRALLVVPFLTTLLAAQVTVSGNVTISGSVQVAAIPGGGPGPLGFADLPVNWVDNTTCNSPGGTYDTEVVLGTTNNIGPNAAGEAIGQPYALTPAGLARRRQQLARQCGQRQPDSALRRQVVADQDSGRNRAA